MRKALVFVIILSLCCMCCTIIVVYQIRHDSQEIVDWIRLNRVVIHSGRRSYTSYSEIRMFDVVRLRYGRPIEVIFSPRSRDDIEFLSRFHRIMGLSVKKSIVSDKDFMAIKWSRKFDQLVSVAIGNCPNQLGLWIRYIPSYRISSLCLVNVAIDDVAIQRLISSRNLRNLTHLTLGNLPISSNGLACLESMVCLKFLSIENCNIGNGFWKHLRKLNDLRQLNVKVSYERHSLLRMRDKDTQWISHMKKLRILWLSGIVVTSKQLRCILSNFHCLERAHFEVNSLDLEDCIEAIKISKSSATFSVGVLGGLDETWGRQVNGTRIWLYSVQE